ncbi:MAG: nucleotide sugar dehydrogenase [Pirellulaceae bacterium]
MKPLEFDLLIVGGHGHVGLPMGIALADAGLQVALYDLNRASGEVIARGEMPFLEYDAEPILKRVIGRTLHLVDRLEAVQHSRTVVVTIGTPVDEYLNPELLPMFRLADDLQPLLRAGHHVILRSTVFPGTTERLADYMQVRERGIHLSFCPERIAQGYAIRELRKLPQIISGVDERSLQLSRELFSALDLKIVELSVREAELAKLFSNAWRYIQFATSNQFFMIATENGADFNRIRYAMTDGYRRAADFPGAGFAAGPCLLKDTMQLSAFYHNNFLLGHAAMLVNEGLPSFLVRQIAARRSLQGRKVGILGMAFKRDVDDTRDSLSYKLAKLLRFHGADVLCSDEFADRPEFVSKEQLVQESEIIIVGAPHSAYSHLTIPSHIEVVDIWNCLTTATAARAAA